MAFEADWDRIIKYFDGVAAGVAAEKPANLLEERYVYNTILSYTNVITNKYYYYKYQKHGDYILHAVTCKVFSELYKNYKKQNDKQIIRYVQISIGHKLQYFGSERKEYVKTSSWDEINDETRINCNIFDSYEERFSNFSVDDLIEYLKNSYSEYEKDAASFKQRNKKSLYMATLQRIKLILTGKYWSTQLSSDTIMRNAFQPHALCTKVPRKALSKAGQRFIQQKMREFLLSYKIN
jgi:hypothetical protein